MSKTVFDIGEWCIRMKRCQKAPMLKSLVHTSGTLCTKSAKAFASDVLFPAAAETRAFWVNILSFIFRLQSTGKTSLFCQSFGRHKQYVLTCMDGTKNMCRHYKYKLS